jgi:Arc/MetJ-type ribon-helix-helix transcriptional regulator
MELGFHRWLDTTQNTTHVGKETLAWSGEGWTTSTTSWRATYHAAPRTLHNCAPPVTCPTGQVRPKIPTRRAARPTQTPNEDAAYFAKMTDNAMGISLNPDLERLISEKISSGRYSSVDEVIREALKLLDQQENGKGTSVTGEAPSPAGGLGDLVELMAKISSTVPQEEWDKLPTDLSKNIDHYLYGHPKVD